MTQAAQSTWGRAGQMLPLQQLQCLGDKPQLSPAPTSQALREAIRTFGLMEGGREAEDLAQPP